VDGAQFCSTLRGVAEKKTEDSNRRFTVQLRSDRKPFLVVQLYQDTIPLLRQVLLGFDLLGGTRVEEAKKLAEVPNEHALDMFVTCEEKGG
jgi:hypothetical protein